MPFDVAGFVAGLAAGFAAGAAPAGFGRGTAFAPGPGSGTWLRHVRFREARNHFVRHGHRVNGRRDFYSAFTHVIFVNAFVGVVVGVMGEGVVVESILIQADARQPGIIK